MSAAVHPRAAGAAHPRASGALAFTSGVPVTACPHRIGSAGRREWIEGYARFARFAAAAPDANVSVVFTVKHAASRDGARWTDAERLFLAAAWPLDGLACRAIAALLAREEPAVRIKASRMGLEKRRKRSSA